MDFFHSKVISNQIAAVIHIVCLGKKQQFHQPQLWFGSDDQIARKGRMLFFFSSLPKTSRFLQHTRTCLWRIEAAGASFSWQWRPLPASVSRGLWCNRRVTAKARLKSGVQMDTSGGSKSCSGQQQRGRYILKSIVTFPQDIRAPAEALRSYVSHPLCDYIVSYTEFNSVRWGIIVIICQSGPTVMQK